MSDSNLFPTSDDPNSDDYKILRKGSVYNIAGPHGREFNRYKSASIVGPRWEELTHTPWPYESSAYTPGMRLWELGLIEREHVGLRQLLTRPASKTPPPVPSPAASTDPPEDVEQADRGDQADQPKHAPESAHEFSPPTSKPVSPPLRESESMQRTSKSVQQALRPAKKYVRGESKKQAKSDPPPKPPKPTTPQKPAKPRQQRLMFQENWDDYREPIKPDGRSSSPEDAESDAEDD